VIGRSVVLTAAMAVTAAGCRPAATPPPTSAPPAALRRANVLLVTIDTLRADRVGAYGSRSGLTPTLDRLAGEGVRMDRAYAHVPLTLPSHTALMTGALPFTNGVRDNGSFRFDGQRPTLAAALKGAGYRTGAFVASFVLDARFGLNAGFDEYDDRNGARSAGGDLVVLERRADAVVDAALRWIGQPAPEAPPWFAWVHLYDPHDPYDPPEPFKSRLAGDAYGGEVAFADAQVGRALQVLGERGQLARTLIVVAADHGEALGEHQERTHGLFVYDATTRVPLVFWAPAALPPAVVRGPVGLVDVMPTVLDFVGVAAVAGDGRSLAAAARGQALEDRDVYLEALNANLTRHWAPLTAIVAGTAKFIDLPQAELYDLAADPGETRNLHSSQPDAAAAIARRLFALRARGRPATPSAVDGDTARRLRSLGYLVTPAAPAGAASAYDADDDPKTLVALHNTLDDALAAVKAGRTADAERLLKTAIAARPDFTVAHDRLAQLYRDTGRLRLAIATLEAVARTGPANAASLAALGGYLQEAGNLTRSAEVLEAARSLNPSEMEVYEKLGITYTRMGRTEQAHAMFAHMLSAAPNSATTLNNLGSLYLSERRWDEALAVLTRAIAIDPMLANAYNGRGVAYAQQGQFDRAIAEWRRALELRPDLADARDNIARAEQLKRQK
jgi:arylsulfatase A-like enzyme/Tfp pilus assembly protein PilF